MASRLEGLTKGMARVLISEDTKNLCHERYRFRDYGSHQVKGREEFVHVFEPEEAQ